MMGLSVKEGNPINFDELTPEDYDDEKVIECESCGEEKAVEVGTWALDKGMCEPCYAIYQGG